MTIQELIQTSGVTFGTSGVRGLETQLTDNLCCAYTQAFLSILKDNHAIKRVALGIDLRPSSPRIASACAQAIRKYGCTVDYCGALPTPALAYYAKEEHIPAIMVTGSHIPFDRNGIKFYRPDGEISKTDEQQITHSQQTFIPSGPAEALPDINRTATDNYIQRYLTFFSGTSLSGLRIGLYEHSSVARDVLRTILEKMGAEVISLARTDTFVPIDTEAVSTEDIARGHQWAQQKFDALISTDGDGDRPLIGDETGTWLRGDIVGILCASYLNIEQLVVPISCNTAIETCGKFTTVHRTRIGSPYVIEKMQALDPAQGAIAGFEANGGFLLYTPVNIDHRRLNPLPTRDAVLPALAVLAAAHNTDQRISGLISTLPKRYTASDRIKNFPDQQSQSIIATLTGDIDRIKQWLPEHIPINQDTTDGLRITMSNQEIIHLRPSGNAPELRCYSEAATPERATYLTAEMIDKILMDNHGLLKKT